MKINAISVNDTAYFAIRAEHVPLIREIRTVYIYEPETGTYLCEMTPSHELRYLYTYLVPHDDVDSELADSLDSEYCHEPNEDTYMHCWLVASMNNPPAMPCGEYDSIEDAIEDLQSNYPF